MVRLRFKGSQTLKWWEIPDDSGIIAKIFVDFISLRPFQYRLILLSSSLRSGRSYCEWIPSRNDLIKLYALLGSETEKWHGAIIILKANPEKKRNKIFLSSVSIKANCKRCNSEVEFWYPDEYDDSKCPKCGSNDFILKHGESLREIDKVIRRLFSSNLA